jgi:putative FmdB family regulatory protein
MPVYEYECKACGHLFEEWQKITDGPVKTCPKCKKKKVERLISQTAFQLKGGGWYKDLYSSSSGKKDADAGGAADSKGKGDSKSDGSSAKSESKSESKADSKSDSKSSKSDAAKPAKGTTKAAK